MKKLKNKVKEEVKNTSLNEELINDITSESNVTVIEGNNALEVLPKQESKGRRKVKSSDNFEELAKLIHKKVDTVKDESYYFHLKNLLGRVGKVIVRYNIKDEALEKLLINANTFNLNGIILSPVFLKSCAKFVKKHSLEKLPICALIDFPFGESLFKSKISDIKESIKTGVDGAVVMIPVALTVKEKIKELKKHLRKYSSMYNGLVSVALNASDVLEEDMKRTLTLIEKYGIKKVTIVFGNATLDMVVKTLKNVCSAVKRLPIDIVSNVESAEVCVELFELGVNNVYTPYADKIGKSLFKKFGIKCAKLV